MEKLTWFKFNVSDWMMGKIMKCPEITQARFLRLCCLYWNKQCSLSVEDAEIEIDKEHLQILIGKKIVMIDIDNIYIKFLDEQNINVAETSQKRREAVQKRWERVKQAATTVLQDDTNVSKPDTSVIQSDTEKNREEERRIENIKKNKFFDFFWEKYPKKVAKEKCRKTFMKLPNADIKAIYQTVEKFASYKPFADYNHPYPETYLSQSRWNDPIPEQKSVQSQINLNPVN